MKIQYEPILRRGMDFAEVAQLGKNQKIFWNLAFLLGLLWLHGDLAFAGQGCCSMHGGVAGCAGAKLRCNDGTLSATCSCQDRSTPSQPVSRSQDGLALLEATPQEAKPYITPVSEPGPAASVDAVPLTRGDKSYITPAVQPEAPSQGDVLPSQKPSEPSVTPVDNLLKTPGYHTSAEPVSKQNEGVRSNDERNDPDSDESREQTPKSHPGEFLPIKGTSAKKNVTTGEVWVRDKSAHGGEHWEVYKDQRAWEKGIRGRQVWADGKTGKRY